MTERAPYTPGEKLLGGSPKVKGSAGVPRKRAGGAAAARTVQAGSGQGEAVPRNGVIRRPDVRDEAFMERMRTARRERGLVGLVEALVAECELPEGWVLDADVHPE